MKKQIEYLTLYTEEMWVIEVLVWRIQRFEKGRTLVCFDAGGLGSEWRFHPDDSLDLHPNPQDIS